MQLEVVTNAIPKASQTVLETLATQSRTWIATSLNLMRCLSSRREPSTSPLAAPTRRWRASEADTRRRLLFDAGIRYEVPLYGKTRTTGGVSRPTCLPRKTFGAE